MQNLFIGILMMSWSIVSAQATPPEKPPVIPFLLTAEGLLRSIYTLPDPDFQAFHDPKRRPLYYSQRIVALAEKSERCYLDKFAMPHNEFDYITIGGDYAMHNLSITTQREDKDVAQLKVSFGEGDYFTELNYQLIATMEGWRINDVTTEKNGSLSEMLENECRKSNKSK